MPFIPRKINVERIDYTAGTMKSRQLPATVVKGLDLGLYVTHASTGAPTHTIAELLEVIDKIDLVLDGSDTQISVPFYFLYYLNLMENASTPDSTIDLTADAGTSSVHVNLPLALLRAINPKDTLLDTRKLSSAVLQAHFKSSVPLSGTAVTITSAHLKILSKEYARVPADAQFARHEFSYHNADLNKTGKIQIDLEAGGNNQYRRIWIFAFASGGALSDVQFDNLKLRDRTFDHVDATAEQIQAENKRLFNQTSITTGLYCLDFPTDGMMTERIDASVLDELVLEINSLVTDGTVTVIKEKVIGRY